MGKWTKGGDENVSDAYVLIGSETFLCSDLFRIQMRELMELLERKDGGILYLFKQKDFSHTAAARTMAFDLK